MPESSAMIPKQRRVSLWQLIAATCFMVSGGPYGLEDLVGCSGYGGAILILLMTPVFWSIPTALMVGELSSSIPEEGGYYVWVRRAFGRFWGFQEAWLSVIASIFDMAIYPTLFVTYFAQFSSICANSAARIAIGVVLIAVCAAWNLRGARAVGRSSILTGVLLLMPFALIAVLSMAHPLPPNRDAIACDGKMMMGILVAMWNFMGWDNASTIAGEVDDPQKTYPLAMGISVALVTLVYISSVAACWHANIDERTFVTGGWATVGFLLGGNWLKIVIILGGCVSTYSIFNSLVMSYSRVPVAMAEDKLLPAVFLKKMPGSQAPWFSILVCSITWSLSLGVGFQHLVELDILFYGASLLLEFAALIALRRKEPDLPRPFKIPGGNVALVLLMIPLVVLIAISLIQGAQEKMGQMNALVFGLVLISAGLLLYLAAQKVNSRGQQPSPGVTATTDNNKPGECK